MDELELILDCDDCEFRATDVLCINDRDVEITTGCNIFKLSSISTCCCFNVNKAKYYNEFMDYKHMEQRIIN